MPGTATNDFALQIESTKPNYFGGAISSGVASAASGSLTLYSVSNANLTTLTTSSPAGNILVGMPKNTGGLGTNYFCGATSGNASCANTATGGTARTIGGIATLSSNTAVISSISPVFTSTSTFTCVADDITTRANPVQVANTSTSSITITNTTGASDVISWVCYGY
jgi:hypothetical protein